MTETPNDLVQNNVYISVAINIDSVAIVMIKNKDSIVKVLKFIVQGKMLQ